MEVVKAGKGGWMRVAESQRAYSDFDPIVHRRCRQAVSQRVIHCIREGIQLIGPVQR